MRIQNILLASLFVSLYGCQPEAPASKAAAPADAGATAAPAPAGQAVPPATNQAPAPAPAGYAFAEKAPQPAAREKTAAAAGKDTVLPTAVAEKPAAVQASAAQVAKTEPVAVASEVKPDAKSEPAVSEADAMQLAKKNNCFACHAVDKKVVGPSFKDVAARYRSDTEAEARLMNKIAKGGSGVWGVMVMPPSPQISEADRKTLTRFVLSLK